MSGLKKLEKLDSAKLAKPGLQKIKKRPPPPAMFDQENPIADLEYTGDIEADAAAELDGVAQGFRDRMAKEAERMKGIAGDYYCVLVFDDGDQCSAFLEGAGMPSRQINNVYIDGREFAERLNIKIPESRLNKNPRFIKDKKLAALPIIGAKLK